MKIVLTGGGTAGHIVPNLTLAKLLHKRGHEIHYIGSTNGMEKNLVAQYPYITYHGIICTKLIRALTLKNLAIPFTLMKSIFQAKTILQSINPDIIFSKGGYVALPVVLASRGIPIVGHESDLSMGLANKIIYKKCTKMCFTFETTAKKYHKKGVFTGSILDNNLQHGSKEAITKIHPTSPSKRNLLIMGGSLGATSINQLVNQHITTITQQYNVIHLVGKGKQSNNTAPNYTQIEYTDHIQNYYAWADVVITRGGSNAIHEIAYTSTPMLIIPLPKSSSRGDQIDNANYFENHGLAKVLLEENLTIEKVMSNIDFLYKYANKYKESMKNYEIGKATEKIILLLEELANKKTSSEK